MVRFPPHTRLFMKSVHSGAGVEEQVLFVLFLFPFLFFLWRDSLWIVRWWFLGRKFYRWSYHLINLQCWNVSELVNFHSTVCGFMWNLFSLGQGVSNEVCFCFLSFWERLLMVCALMVPRLKVHWWSYHLIKFQCWNVSELVNFHSTVCEVMCHAFPCMCYWRGFVCNFRVGAVKGTTTYLKMLTRQGHPPTTSDRVKSCKQV